MGERVVVGRVAPPQSADDARGKADASAGVAPPEPLNYGRGDRAGDAWRWSRAQGAAWMDNIKPLTGVLVRMLGGWPRIGFAVGLACVLAGLGDCLIKAGDGGVFWMFMGGLLVGFTLRVPLRESNS